MADHKQLFRTCPSFQTLDDPDDAYEANLDTLGDAWETVPKEELYLLTWGDSKTPARAPALKPGQLSNRLFAWLSGCSAQQLAQVQELARQERDRQAMIRALSASEKERRTPLFVAFKWLELEMRKFKLRDTTIDSVYSARLGVLGIAGVSEQRAWEAVTALRNGYVQMVLELYAHEHGEDSDEFRAIAQAVHGRFKSIAATAQPPNNACCTQCAPGTGRATPPPAEAAKDATTKKRPLPEEDRDGCVDNGDDAAGAGGVKRPKPAAPEHGAGDATPCALGAVAQAPRRENYRNGVQRQT